MTANLECVSDATDKLVSKGKQKKCRNALTAARAREVLDYNPETGEFRWKVDRGGRTRAGDVAGKASWNGYHRIRVDGFKYGANQLAWLWTYGEMPAVEVDHIDKDPGNDRISNLRLATPEQNSRNRKAHINSTHGIKGVARNGQKFAARIVVAGTIRRLGTYNTPFEAWLAYSSAAKEYFGEYAFLQDADDVRRLSDAELERRGPLMWAARKDSTIGIRGVSRRGSVYCARIRNKGKIKHLGTYDTPHQAWLAYAAAAKAHFVEYLQTESEVKRLSDLEMSRRASEQQQQLPLVDAPTTAPAESFDHENV